MNEKAVRFCTSGRTKIIFYRLSALVPNWRIIERMDVSERKFCRVADTADSAVAVSRAIAGLSETDLLRLNALARLRARGLPEGIVWSDLLHEALARALDGSRQWPDGLPFLMFVSGIMRSLGDEIWQRHKREAAVVLPGRYEDQESRNAICPAASQERVIAAIQAISAIHRLFAGDQVATKIIAGMSNAMTAEEIRQANGLSQLEYDTARRRMRRTLLRAGLSGEIP